MFVPEPRLTRDHLVAGIASALLLPENIRTWCGRALIGWNVAVWLYLPFWLVG